MRAFPAHRPRLNVSMTATDAHPSDAGFPETLLSVYGRPLLEYILGPAQVGPEAAKRRSKQLDELQALWQQSSGFGSAVDQRLRLLQSFRRQGHHPFSALEAIRQERSDCEWPRVSDADPVERSLYELACVAFPQQLLSPLLHIPATLRSAVSRLSAYMDPHYSVFADAILQDDAMARLFPGFDVRLAGDDSLVQPYPRNVSSNVIWTSGPSTVNLTMLADSMLEYMFADMRLAGELVPEVVHRYVRKVLDTCRRLARKERVQMPVVTTLLGVHWDDGVIAVPLAAGELRRNDLVDLFPNVDPDAHAVLMTHVSMQLLDVLPASAEGSHSEEFSRKWRHHSRAVERAQRQQAKAVILSRLALLLASPTSGIVGSVVKTSGLPHPLTAGSGSWQLGHSETSPLSSITAATIDANVAVTISNVSAQLTAYPDSLLLGARRLLTAAAERSDPLDGLVDAVICWENMFGSGEGEVSFKVCGSLALLLHPDDPSARLQLFQELKGLYKQRSVIVHGASEPKQDEVIEMYTRAVRIGLDALAALLLRQDLRSAPTSMKRSQMLLLGTT